MESYGEEKNESEGERYEINKDFYDEFDSWDGVNPNKTFVIGNTSKALQSIGVKNQEIRMHSGMIIRKINKHAEMKIDYFREIPKLLEEPVIIQFSDAIDEETGIQKYDSSITVLGELFADMAGKKEPVLVSLELLPEKKLKIRDFALVKSAYGHSKLQQYLNNNSILYIDSDKKRTNNWLSRTRLQLPVGENQRGSIRRITYSDGKVKIENSIHETNFQRALRKAGIVDEFGNYRRSVDDTIDGWDDFDLFEDNAPVNIEEVVKADPERAVEAVLGFVECDSTLFSQIFHMIIRININFSIVFHIVFT